jgi:release factor glutamine methyltransferase
MKEAQEEVARRLRPVTAFYLREARLLIEKAEGERDRLEALISRRLNGEPLSRILGEAEFWSLPFVLSHATLEPRPDSEILVETALKIFPEKQARLRLCDLGTGSGCLLVSLLHERPHAFGIGVDLSFKALETARGNAVRNGTGERAAFVQAHWCAGLFASFDLVVSNPPYIARSVLSALAPEVCDHDPVLALDGGEDGLCAYRLLLDQVPAILAENGRFLVEIGYDQGESVPHLARMSGWRIEAIIPDYAGHPRVVIMNRS